MGYLGDTLQALIKTDIWQCSGRQPACLHNDHPGTSLNQHSVLYLIIMDTQLSTHII